MFVQSEGSIAAYGGGLGHISTNGQEANGTTWRLAKMNLAMRCIDGQIAHGVPPAGKTGIVWAVLVE